MNEELLKEIKSTLPWLLAAAILVGGYYAWKNHRAAQRTAASQTVASAYTATELEDAVTKFGGTPSAGALKIKLAKSYYDAGRYDEAMKLYDELAANAPDGFADIPAVLYALAAYRCISLEESLNRVSIPPTSCS